MRENHGLQFILDDIDGKLRRNAAEIRNVAGNHNFLSELPAAGESWQMRMGDNSLREAFNDYPLMGGDGCIVSRRNRIIRWYPKANGDRLIIDARQYYIGDVIDVIVHGGTGFDSLVFRGINREGNAEDVYSLGRIGKDSAEMVRFVGGGSNIEWNSRWRADGSGGSGRGFHAWNSSAAMTNISQIQGMQAGDYVVNAYSAAVSILGASRATGDVVQATSNTAGVLAGNIRGAAGAQGPRGYTGAAGSGKTLNITIDPTEWTESNTAIYICLGSFYSNGIVHYSATAAQSTTAMNGNASVTEYDGTTSNRNSLNTINNSRNSSSALAMGVQQGSFNHFHDQYGGMTSVRHHKWNGGTTLPNATTSGCTCTWQFVVNTYYGELYLVHLRTAKGDRNKITGHARLCITFFGNFYMNYTGDTINTWSLDNCSDSSYPTPSNPTTEDGYKYHPSFGYCEKRHPIYTIPLFA